MRFTITDLSDLAEHFQSRADREQRTIDNPRSLKGEVTEAKGALRAYNDVVETINSTTIEE